jgi:hypothetical protein
MWDRIADLWCRKMHNEAMWPIHGKYVCKRCFREYPVEWEGHAASAEESAVHTESPVWLTEHR